MITTKDLKTTAFIKQLTAFLNSSRFKQELTYLMLSEKSSIEKEKNNIQNSNQLLDYLYNVSNESGLFNNNIDITYNMTTNSLHINEDLEADDIVILDRNFYNKSMNKAWFSFIKGSSYIVPEETVALFKNNILKFVENKQKQMFESLLDAKNEKNSFIISKEYFQNLEFDSETILNHVSDLLKNNQFEDIFNYLEDLTESVKYDFIHLILTRNFHPEKHLIVLDELFDLSQNDPYIKKLFFLKLFEIEDFKILVNILLSNNYWSYNFIKFLLNFLSKNQFNEDVNPDLIFEIIEGFNEIFDHAKKDVIEIIQDKKQHDNILNIANLFNVVYQANRIIQDKDLTELLHLTLNIDRFKELVNSSFIGVIQDLLDHNMLQINIPKNIDNNSIYQMIKVFNQYNNCDEYNQIIDILKSNLS